jgi:NhaA family Na+:H+ antiporter
MKSERNAALIMLTAAMCGLLLANSPYSSQLLGLISAKLHLDFLSLHITVGHLVSDLLLAIFFLIAGLELKYELRMGTLSTISKAMVPVAAAVAGILVPAGIYIYLNFGQSSISGWPIPTATDIAFALGVLALFGRGMPAQARVFLLALAIFDDLVAISIIAIAYTSNLNLSWLIATVAAAIGFRFAEKSKLTNKWILRIIFGLILWYTVYQSGVHATVAGVLMGLIIPAARSHSVMAKIQPTSNLIILPVFAFTAVAVVIPEFQAASNPVFTGTFLGLALGKVIGISIVGFLMNELFGGKDKLPLRYLDFTALGFLGGIGFTVSLLMSQLAFRENPDLYAQATLGVMIGSFVSMAMAGIILSFRSKQFLGMKKLKLKSTTRKRPN